jgi:hypothetical protein
MALRGFGLGQCTSSLPSIVTHLQPLSHRVVSILKLDLVAAGLCEDYVMGAVLAGYRSGAVNIVDNSQFEHAEIRI